MRSVIIVGAAAALAVPLVMVWSWVSVLTTLGPSDRSGADAPPPPAASPPAASVATPVAPAAATAPPLPPRLDYRTVPSRAAPTPVQPGQLPASGPFPAVRPLPPAPPPSQWASVEIVNPFGVGSPSPAITKAIKTTLRAQLSSCFGRDAQAGWSGLGKAYSTLAPGDAPALGPAILVLEVEAAGSGVKVVDAPVERRGSVSDGTLNCAQAVLRGAAIDAPSEGRGRFRMRFPLRQ